MDSALCHRPTARARALAAAASLLLAATPCALQDSITNGLVTLHFDLDDPDMGLALTGIGDSEDANEFSLARRPLWELSVTGPNFGGQSIAVAPDRSTGVTFDYTVLQDNAKRVKVRWSNVRHPDFPGNERFAVVATILTRNGDQNAVFRLWTTSSVNLKLEATNLSYPRIEIPSGPNPASEILAVPFWEGALYMNPTTNQDLVLASLFGEPEVNPGPLNMQWFAFYDESDPDEGLLYWGTRDFDGVPKDYRIDPEAFVFPPTLGLSIDHVPVNKPNGGFGYNVTYDAVLGVMRGDWYDAARYYRSDFAVKQSGTLKGPMATNPDFSATVRDADMFGILNLNFCLVQPPGCAATGIQEIDTTNWLYAAQQAQELQDYFVGSKVLYHLYFWGFNSFTSQNGEWYPFNTTWQNDFLPQVPGLDMDWVPYFQTLQYSATAQSYANSYVPGFLGSFLEDFVRVEEDGSLAGFDETYCDHFDPCDPLEQAKDQFNGCLCQSTPFIDAYLRDVVDRMNHLGASAPSGIYLDQLHLASEVCYSEEHEKAGYHPAGGGSYWTQSKIEQVRSLKSYARDELGVDEFYVYGEAPFEPLIGDVEFSYGHHGGVTTVDGVRAAAPLFQTVYHDYMRVGSLLGFDVPQSVPFITDPFVWFSARQAFAANVFIGQVPYLTSRAWILTFASRLNPVLLPDFNRHVEMGRNYMDLLQLDPVRQYTVLQERLREPVTDAGKAHMDLVPVTDLLPYSAAQDVVYTAMYGKRGPLGFQSLLMLNWTDPADPTISPGGQPLFESGVVPGDQTVTVTVDPEEYGMFQIPFALWEVVPGSLGLVKYAQTLDLSGGPGSVTIDVPARSARFFILVPMP